MSPLQMRYAGQFVLNNKCSYKKVYKSQKPHFASRFCGQADITLGVKKQKRNFQMSHHFLVMGCTSKMKASDNTTLFYKL